MRVKLQVFIAVSLFLASALLSVGGSIWYTNAAIRHECAALRVLTSHEVHLQNTKFKAALIEWRDADYC